MISARLSRAQSRISHRGTETQSKTRFFSVSRCLCGVFLSVFSLFLCVGLASAQSAVWPSERPPQPLAARDIKFPPYEIQTLPNGLQVVVVMHHEQPAVTMRLLVRAGTAADPRDKLGLAHLAASLLDQGTKTMSAEEMNDAVDFIGGAMGAGAGTDLTFCNMVVMKDSFDTGLRMLSDMARQPAFAPAEIERQRQQMLSGQKVSAEDPGYIANSVFDRLVYGFHPYGMPESGTPETIAGLTREDLTAFHTRYFMPNNAILAIVGDVTAEEAFAAAKKVFGDWAKRDLPVQTLIGPPEPTRRVIVVNKPDAVQTEVRVGHIGIPRTHPDYMAVNLAIRILGGEGSNRLHQVLRTERGLTYGAQANMDTLKDSGDFEAETNTRSDATGEVLRLIVDEFWRLQRERVGERELDGAKAYLTGSFPLTIETPESIAMQVVNALFYGLPLAELQNFRERVNAVTPDDIQRVAKALLRPDRLSVVLVGNSSAFASQLRGVGFATFETVELADLDLTAASFKRAPDKAQARIGAGLRVGPDGHVGPSLRLSYQQAPLASRPSDSASPDEKEKAIALLDQVIAAKGGLDKLRDLKSIVARQTQASQRPDGESMVETTNYIEYPNHLRVETKGQVQGFDGEHVWMKDTRGVHDAPETFVREMAAGLRRDVVSLLLAAKAGTINARLLPDVKEADGVVSHALELSALDMNPIVLYVLPETSQIHKRVYAADAPGRPIVEETFFDYRDVNGIQFAYRATQKVGAASVERRVTDVKINTPLDPALFKRPAS
jgi:predicted Zn-dependent peptidase/outer membrane lipoprotein-sorting protein